MTDAISTNAENDDSYEIWQSIEIEAYAAYHELTVDYVIAEFVIEGYLVQVWPNGDDAVPV